jgi:hypothetical protein
MINTTPENKKVLRSHANEALKEYSPIMTWLVLDDGGDLLEVVEPQGQSEYVGDGTILARTGGFSKSHGDGTATNEEGVKYKTQKAYLADLLGHDVYLEVFAK